MEEPRKYSTTSSTSSRSLLSRSFVRREESNQSLDAKGPIGLNTLYEPDDSDTVADLVFVHGLGGGSRSTWTKAGDASLFWPREWLPRDPDFRNVRVHSFGYNSNLDKESTLNLHDFSKSLLVSLHDCPAIRRGPSVRIIPTKFNHFHYED